MRRQFTLAFKLKVIRHYEIFKSYVRTSREFVVDRKTLRGWVSGKEELKRTKLRTQRTKRQYKDTKTQYPNMESELYTWIKYNRTQGACIGGRQILLKALEIMKNIK